MADEKKQEFTFGGKPILSKLESMLKKYKLTSSQDELRDECWELMQLLTNGEIDQYRDSNIYNLNQRVCGLQ